jgi:hypothetical protein
MKHHALLLALLTGPALAPAQTVLRFDGRQLNGAVKAITATQVLVGDQTIDRAEVRTIAFTKDEPADLMTRPGQHVVIARDGSRLAVADESVAEGRLLATVSTGKATLPLEGIVGLLRPGADDKPATLDSIPRDRSEQDVLLVGRHSSQTEPVAGILQSLDPQQVRFRYENTDTTMAAATVLRVELAKLDGKPLAAANGQVLCTDGSLLVFSQVTATAKEVTVTSPALGVLRLDPARVARITLAQAGRLTYLSALEPVSVKQAAFFREGFAYRKDKSVIGQPLRVAGVAYERGLGLHARCELTYDLGGQYRQFTATAGIDDSVLSGVADVTVQLDGKPLLARQRLDRAQPPPPLRLDVQGGQRLTILVDFVDGAYGSGSRVDLCEAALTK